MNVGCDLSIRIARPKILGPAENRKVFRGLSIGFAQQAPSTFCANLTVARNCASLGNPPKVGEWKYPEQFGEPYACRGLCWGDCWLSRFPLIPRVETP